MWVQFAQDVVHGHIYNAVRVYFVYILIVDIIDKSVEFIFLGIGGKEFLR